MSQPFFSVIVPSYNRAGFLPRCIESVQHQTFSDWELILIDDGSTDQTKEVVTRYANQDARVRYCYQPNGGVSVARNKALKIANGKFLCFLDSDDAYDDNHLQFFYGELKKRNFSDLFLVTNFRFKTDSEDLVIEAPKPTEYKDKSVEKIMKVYLPFSPCVQTICVPALVKEKVSFDGRLSLSECYDFNARAAALVDDVLFFPLTTVTLYGHTGNASIPRNLDESTAFNSRQYNEFLLMSKEAFYRTVSKTAAFKKRLFRLQLELVKIAVQKRQAGAFLKSITNVLRYNPTYPFQLNYANIVKKATRKMLRRSVANS